MKKWASTVLLFFAIVTGCVPTLNPIYTDKDLIFDPALLGTWGSDDPREKWVFEKTNEKWTRQWLNSPRGFRVHVNIGPDL